MGPTRTQGIVAGAVVVLLVIIMASHASWMKKHCKCDRFVNPNDIYPPSFASRLDFGAPWALPVHTNDLRHY